MFFTKGKKNANSNIRRNRNPTGLRKPLSQTLYEHLQRPTVPARGVLLWAGSRRPWPLGALSVLGLLSNAMTLSPNSPSRDFPPPCLLGRIDQQVRMELSRAKSASSNALMPGPCYHDNGASSSVHPGCPTQQQAQANSPITVGWFCCRYHALCSQEA